MMKCVLAVLVVLSLSQVQAQNTFCERYTLALFGQGVASQALNASLQFKLVDAVVNRAFVGIQQFGLPNNVTGLYYETNNAPYFNSQDYPFIDYLNPSSSSQLTTLVAHLDQFFMLALQCRAGAAANPWTFANLTSIHVQMGITQVTETAFVGQVAASLTSFGVPSTSGATTDLGYVAPRMGLFGRYASTGSAFQVCGDSTCSLAFGMGEFDTSSTGAFSDISLLSGVAANNYVCINVGDYVHWNLGATDGVTQADTITSTTPTTGGWSSGIGTRTYTLAFATAGSYYFYNAGATSNHGAVYVGSTNCPSMMMSSSSSSTASTTSSSTAATGTGGASSVQQISTAVFGAAVVAAAAILA
jgi:hypothetical protein